MILFKIVLLVLFNYTSCESINNVRNEYHNFTSEKSIDEFINKYSNLNCIDFKPYVASAIMQKAQYAFSPLKKLKYFNQGKKLLESFIEENPNHVEARYVRVLVQSESPSFLGYTKNIQSDINFIKSKIATSQLPISYQNLMLKNINYVLNKQNLN